MHELMFQAGVKGMSERSELIPCNNIIIITSNELASLIPVTHKLMHQLYSVSSDDVGPKVLYM